MSCLKMCQEAKDGHNPEEFTLFCAVLLASFQEAFHVIYPIWYLNPHHNTGTLRMALDFFIVIYKE